MPRFPIVFTILACFWVSNARASDDLPTLEDAGYAYEASEQCEAMTATIQPTRRLGRKDQFRAGRYVFKNAIEQWGRDWACATAQENHGAVIDLGKYDISRRTKQRRPAKLPPVPVFQLELFDIATAIE